MCLVKRVQLKLGVVEVDHQNEFIKSRIVHRRPPLKMVLDHFISGSTPPVLNPLSTPGANVDIYYIYFCGYRHLFFAVPKNRRKTWEEKPVKALNETPFLIIRDTAIIGSFHTHALSFQISFSVTAVCCPLDRESFLFFFLFFLPRSRYRKIMNAQMKDVEPVAK